MIISKKDKEFFKNARNMHEYFHAIKNLICGDTTVQCSIRLDQYENNEPKRGIDSAAIYRLDNMVGYYIFSTYLPEINEHIVSELMESEMLFDLIQTIYNNDNYESELETFIKFVKSKYN